MKKLRGLELTGENTSKLIIKIPVADPSFCDYNHLIWASSAAKIAPQDSF